MKKLPHKAFNDPAKDTRPHKGQGPSPHGTALGEMTHDIGTMAMEGLSWMVGAKEVTPEEAEQMKKASAQYGGTPMGGMLSDIGRGISKFVVNLISEEVTPEMAKAMDEARQKHGATPVAAMFKGKPPKGP